MLGLIVLKFKRGVNWPFKTFSLKQYLTQFTENKSIYVKMNKFISALFLFEKRLYSKVNHKIMQIDFPDAHTLILERKPVKHKTANFNIKQVIKVQLIALTISWATYHSQSVPVAFNRFYMFLSESNNFFRN